MSTHIPPFKPDRTLFPFESNWFDSSVGRVHYIDEGEGAPILFLHGNPTWSFLYRGIVIRLKKHFRCIALDYPGFGLSEHPLDYDYKAAEHAGVVRELVQSLDLRDLTIMGQDWGGPIGMRLALDEFERLRALVMGNTWYWPAEAWQMNGFGYVMSSQPMQYLILEKNLFVEKMIPFGTKHVLAAEVTDHYRQPFPTSTSRLGVAEFPKEILNAASWLGDLSDRVPQVLSNVPLLLTWGIHDLAFGPKFMDRFREDFRLVTVRRLDAKHFIQEDAPAEISRAIEEFLAV